MNSKCSEFLLYKYKDKIIRDRFNQYFGGYF